ncbi:MAG: hydrogenase [Actinobacteria bacterium]|jgi:hydrogenase-4 component E|nr:hydrogenase [Actinomycetota bacterium]MCL6095217.1 hydrogenase [Actinomycetota bacterium]
MFAPPSVLTSTAEVVAIVVLLAAFGMLRAPLITSQINLYRLQSLAVTALAVVVGATHGLVDIYILAVASFLLKVIVVPAVILSLLREADSDIAHSNVLKVPSMILVALVVSLFGFITVDALHLRSVTLPVPALGIAVAAILVSFVIIVFRSDVISQAMGFFSLENAVSMASLAVATAVPLVMELAFLFDLLVAVVAFGMLMRVHHRRTGTLSTDPLDRLRG